MINDNYKNPKEKSENPDDKYENNVYDIGERRKKKETDKRKVDEDRILKRILEEADKLKW